MTQPQDTFFHLSVDPQACIGPCDVTTSFECDASGYPQPTYEWFEDRNSGVRLGFFSIKITGDLVKYSDIDIAVYNPNLIKVAKKEVFEFTLRMEIATLSLGILECFVIM